MTEPEVSALYAKGYDTKGLSREYYEKDPQLKAAIDMVADGTFSDGDKDTYKDLVNDWLTKDYFMTLADFRAYMDIQAQIEETYRDPMKWSRMAVLNVANSGYFSSDRSIEDYLERIWHTGPLRLTACAENQKISHNDRGTAFGLFPLSLYRPLNGLHFRHTVQCLGSRVRSGTPRQARRQGVCG